MGAIHDKLTRLVRAAMKELGDQGAAMALDGNIGTRVSTEDTDALQAELTDSWLFTKGLEGRDMPPPDDIRIYDKFGCIHPVVWDAEKTEVVIFDHLEVANVFEL